MPAFTEGVQSGTLAANVLLADTGPIGAGGGVKFPIVWISSTVTGTFEFQQRNAANNANIWAHRFFVSALAPCVVSGTADNTALTLATDERIRLVLITGILGTVQGTLIL